MFRPSNRLLPLVLLISARFTVCAEDQVLPYAPEELFLINRQYPTGLKEDDLRNLTLSDPKLRIAYAFLIGAARGGPKIVDERTPEMLATLNDLKRRGDSATPLMLDIMEKNHNTSLEDLIPLIISRIGTIKMEPYLQYLRQMVKTRPDEISAAANEVAGKLFLEHGTPEDAKMMQDLAKKRPFLATSLERAHDYQRRKHPDRSNATETTKSATAATLPMPQPPAPKKAAEAKPSTASEESTSSTPWFVWTVLIMAACGLLWLLVEKRK
jgi:hypothetical protein